MESRLLLTGNVDSPVQYLLPPPNGVSIPLVKGTIPVSYDVGNPAIDPTLDFVDSTDLGMNNDFPQTLWPSVAPSQLMSVYDEVDPGHVYAMKTVDYASSIEQASPVDNGASLAGAMYMAPAPRLQVTGALGGPLPPAEYRIPLGPSVSGLRFGLSSLDRSSPAFLPYFDSVSIYDQNGQKRSEMSSGWEPDHNALHAMLVSLGDVTTGWSLVVRISSRSSSGLAQTISNNSGIDSANLSQQENPSGTGNTSYVLTVEEYTGSLSGNVGMAGSTPATDSMSWSIASSGGDVAPHSYTTSTENSEDRASDVTEELQVPTAPAGSSSVNVRIPTGPLVTRGATAFGGFLANASTEDDPAPAIERFDQMLVVSLETLGHEIDPSRIKGQSDLDPDSPIIDRAIETDGEFVVVGRTPGDLPLVASESIGPLAPDQAAAFFATLPSPASEVPAPDPSLELAQNVVADPKEKPASWSSTALGLAISLTVTSGTYLPAFLSRLRKSKLQRANRRQRQVRREPQGNR